MNLSHYDFENVFLISHDIINVLVIEPQDKFFEYCDELNKQINGDSGNFVLSDGDSILNLSKTAFFVYDYFNFNINDKKILNKLYQSLSLLSDNKFYNEYHRLCADFVNLFQKMNTESDCSLEYEGEQVFTDILKTFGVKLSEDGDFLERLCEFIRVCSVFLNIKLFFFVNLKNVLTEKQLFLFYKEMALNGICVFLLENSEKPKLKDEKITIIDNDLCEIVV